MDANDYLLDIATNPHWIDVHFMIEDGHTGISHPACKVRRGVARGTTVEVETTCPECQEFIQNQTGYTTDF